MDELAMSLGYGLMALGGVLLLAGLAWLAMECLWRQLQRAHGLNEIQAALRKAKEHDGLVRALSECRDAFPPPEPSTKAEMAWAQAIGDPLGVPAFVRLMAKQREGV